MKSLRDGTKFMCPVKRSCGGVWKTRCQIEWSAVRAGIREHCSLIPAPLFSLAARVPRVRVALRSLAVFPILFFVRRGGPLHTLGIATQSRGQVLCGTFGWGISSERESGCLTSKAVISEVRGRQFALTAMYVRLSYRDPGLPPHDWTAFCGAPVGKGAETHLPE